MSGCASTTHPSWSVVMRRNGDLRFPVSSIEFALACRRTCCLPGAHMPSTTTSLYELSRRPGLTGLRALAVTAVVLTHLRLPIGEGGFVGVDLFFVLSGFLITVLLLEERQQHGRIRVLAFYRRRAFRLIPALLLLLVVQVLLALAVLPSGPKRTVLASVPWVGAYVANWGLISHRGFGFGQLAHTWSLAVEEQFYLIWPLVLALTLRLRHGRAVAAALAIVGSLAAIAVRVTLWNEGAHIWRIYGGTDTRADQLLIGCLLAIAFNAGMLHRFAGSLSRVAAVVGVLGLAAVALSNLAWDNSIYDTVGMTGTALLAALAIIGVLLADESRLTAALSARPLVGLGIISYGVYLWQVPVVRLLVKIAPTAPGALRALAAIPMIIAIASASYVLVERPLMAVGRSGRRLRTANAQPHAGPALIPKPLHRVAARRASWMGSAKGRRWGTNPDGYAAPLKG